MHIQERYVKQLIQDGRAEARGMAARAVVRGMYVYIYTYVFTYMYTCMYASPLATARSNDLTKYITFDHIMCMRIDVYQILTGIWDAN